MECVDAIIKTVRQSSFGLNRKRVHEVMFTPKRSPHIDHTIQSFSGQHIKVNGESFPCPLLIGPKGCSQGMAESFEACGTHELALIKAHEPSILLVGTGSHRKEPTPELYSLLIPMGLPFEIMNSDGACRTYNLLLHDRHRVCLLLFPR